MYGARLKMLRGNLGLSQQQFAESLGVSQTTYSSYERERTQPPFDLLTKICSIYNVDIKWLLGVENTDWRDIISGQYDDFADLVSMGFSTDEAYRMEQEQFKRYGDLIMRLNYDDRKKVVEFIESLKGQSE